MITNLSHVMTLANSVIGVSVLAMPFCFKQCGIVLSILMLLVSSVLSKLACHFLVKSAVMSRRRNFEFLAFHAFGRTGKFLAELFIIGFLMGTCIAFFVVVGDLGPEIVGKMIDKTPEDIRTSLLIFIGVSIILPLGLLRNVDSLSTICTATIGFYLCLVLKIMTESMTHIFATDWYDKVFYWRPSGILQCLPIFSMALFCQTQLFEIYEAIPNVCLEKMNRVVHVALNISTALYICVGFFGYVAFCTLPFTGNILMSLEPSLSSEAIKIGFVLSVAFSFPLVIFPCRASLNSLLFRWAHSYDTSSNYIPETRFRLLTFLIVGVSLITGILIPNIEFVLGLVGSTIGVMICLMFPAAFFISISSKNTNERLIAQAILFIGVWIMILGTYANLYAMEESANIKLTVTTKESLIQLNHVPLEMINQDDAQVAPRFAKIAGIQNIEDPQLKPAKVKKVHEDNDLKDDARQEPPIPVERAVVTEKLVLETQKSNGHLAPTLSPVLKESVKGKVDSNLVETSVEEKHKHRTDGKDAEGKNEVVDSKNDDKIKDADLKNDKHKTDNLIHSDAIRKEELAELAENAEDNEKHEELIKTLAKHEIAQRQMLQEQIEIINNLKQQKQELEKEKKEKLASKKAAKKVDRDNRDINVLEAEDKQNNNSPRELNNLTDHEDSKANSKERNDKSPSKLAPVNDKTLKDTETKDEQGAGSKDPTNKTDDELAMKKSRGPILGALAKQVSNHSKANDVPGTVNNNDIKAPNGTVTNHKTKPNADGVKHSGTNLSDDTQQALKGNQVNAPIALIMSEKTKMGGQKEEQAAPKKTDGTLEIRRDILQSQDRKRREIQKVVPGKYQKFVNSDEVFRVAEDQKLVNGPAVQLADQTQEGSETGNDKYLIKDIAREQECAKTDESPVNNVNKKPGSQKEERNGKEVTTESLLIKTNSYLSDQSVVNQNSFNKNLGVKEDQRDLRPLSSKNGNTLK